MSTPALWAELVTTALLGTDRRPAAGNAADPPRSVLDQAARHRVVDRLAAPGAPPAPASDEEPATEVAPAQDRPEAPLAADRLLTDLLRVPEPALVTCWLGACVDHGCVVAAVHWTRLARLAARTSAYDRRLLGESLGPRGRWFLRQNRDWRRLAADTERPPDPEVVAPAEPVPPLTGDDVLAEPERIFAQPPPWVPELVSAAYAVLGGEGRTPPARTFATRLGVALPAELYPSIAEAGEFYVLAPDASPAHRRTIRDRFVALELAAYARAAIEHAFGTSDTGFTRAEIPHV